MIKRNSESYLEKPEFIFFSYGILANIIVIGFLRYLNVMVVSFFCFFYKSIVDVFISIELCNLYNLKMK